MATTSINPLVRTLLKIAATQVGGPAAGAAVGPALDLVDGVLTTYGDSLKVMSERELHDKVEEFTRNRLPGFDTRSAVEAPSDEEDTLEEEGTIEPSEGAS